MDSVRLWKDRRYNGVQKRFGRVFPVLPETARESVANDNAIPRDDPAKGWYFPAVSPQPLAILSILTYRNSPPSAAKGGSSVFFRGVAGASQTFTASRCWNPSDLNSLLPLPPSILVGFQAKTFGAPPALSYYVSAIVPFRFPPNNTLVRTMAVWNILLSRYLYRLQQKLFFPLVITVSVSRLIFCFKRKVKQREISLIVNIK